MNINIDIYDTMINGIVIDYEPVVHWFMNDSDQLDIDELNKMKMKLTEVITNGLQSAMKKRNDSRKNFAD